MGPRFRGDDIEIEMSTSSSNSKFRNTKEAPTEPFKRSVASCLKAIAKSPELDVSFAAERPGLAPGKARLPEPARKMTKRDAAIVRGHADSIALKIACHDAKLHRKLMPGNPQARGVFEAVEQARVEAIGARRMAGVAKNLTAMLDDHFHRGKFDEITDRADAPLADALAMLVRERLTGMAPPTAAKKMVDLWRPILEDKIGKRLDRLDTLVEDQTRFGDAVHDLLTALDIGDERNADSEDNDDNDENQDGDNDQSGAEGSPDSDAAQEMSADQAQASSEEMSESAMESAQASTSDTFDDGEASAMTRRRARRRVRIRTARTSRAGRNTTPSRRSSTRSSPPRIFATMTSWSACAPISTSSSRICKASSRVSPTGCSAS